MKDSNFKEAARQVILHNIPRNEQDSRLWEELQRKDLNELLAIFYNARLRQVAIRPRVVLMSSRFKARMLTFSKVNVLFKIISEIEAGRNINKYLSERIKIGYSLPRRPKKRLRELRHLDLLLSEWGIHHLHVSGEIQENGFVRRGQYLIFAIFTENYAYCLDILDHDSFEDENLVRIAVSNWPDANLFTPILGVKSARGEQKLSIDQRKVLRNAGIATTVNIDGREYIGRNAISTAGISFRAVRWADIVTDIIDKLSNRIEENIRGLEGEFEKFGMKLPSEPQFQFELLNDGVGLLETKSRLRLLLYKF